MCCDWDPDPPNINLLGSVWTKNGRESTNSCCGDNMTTLWKGLLALSLQTHCWSWEHSEEMITPSDYLKRLRRALVCVSFYFGIFGDRQCDRLTMCRTIQASRFQMQLLSFTSRVCIHLTQTLATPLVFLFFFSILSFSMHRCRPEHHTRDERVW